MLIEVTWSPKVWAPFNMLVLYVVFLGRDSVPEAAVGNSWWGPVEKKGTRTVEHSWDARGYKLKTRILFVSQAIPGHSSREDVSMQSEHSRTFLVLSREWIPRVSSDEVREALHAADKMRAEIAYILYCTVSDDSVNGTRCRRVKRGQIRRHLTAAELSPHRPRIDPGLR